MKNRMLKEKRIKFAVRVVNLYKYLCKVFSVATNHLSLITNHLSVATILLIGIPLMTQAQSPYISKVYEYRPAPGQFINELPEYEHGDSPNEMRLKAEECIANNERILVSLGGYGGYIVFGFDHLVENVPDKYDFKILGNAFYANANPNPDAPREGGSCEPGVVMVSYDVNGNGRPDDEWYELAGSEYYKPETIHNYQITYYRPDENKERTPDLDYPFLNDTTYIRWTTNGYGNGYLYRNIFHHQRYYPQWITDDALVFEGTKLANNYIDESGNGSYYVQYAYAWGYVDNHPNHDDRSSFNIEWAVNSNGEPVHLPGIHFVKVYTGVNQYCGWLGETSTEIMGAQDLHLPETITANADVKNEIQQSSLKLLRNPVENQLIVASKTVQDAIVYNLSGQRMLAVRLQEGVNYISCGHLPNGMYILNSGNNSVKFVKQ